VLIDVLLADRFRSQVQVLELLELARLYLCRIVTGRLPGRGRPGPGG